MQSERGFCHTPVKWEDMTARTETLKKITFFFYSVYYPSYNQAPLPPLQAFQTQGLGGLARAGGTGGGWMDSKKGK